MAWEPAMIYNSDKVITYNSPPSSNLSHQKLKYCYHNFYLSLSIRNISKRYHSLQDSRGQPCHCHRSHVNWSYYSTISQFRLDILDVFRMLSSVSMFTLDYNYRERHCTDRAQ